MSGKAGREGVIRSVTVRAFLGAGAAVIDDAFRSPVPRKVHSAELLSPGQGGYIFYAGASLAGVSCRRRWPRLLLLS